MVFLLNFLDFNNTITHTLEGNQCPFTGHWDIRIYETLYKPPPVYLLTPQVLYQQEPLIVYEQDPSLFIQQEDQIDVYCESCHSIHGKYDCYVMPHQEPIQQEEPCIDQCMEDQIEAFAKSYDDLNKVRLLIHIIITISIIIIIIIITFQLNKDNTVEYVDEEGFEYGPCLPAGSVQVLSSNSSPVYSRSQSPFDWEETEGYGCDCDDCKLNYY